MRASEMTLWQPLIWGTSLATAYTPAAKPERAAPQPQHVHFEALQEENKELKELVVALSKLIIKYVVQEHGLKSCG
jgi:hypothetical protein